MPPRSAPVQSEASSPTTSGAPRVETYSSKAGGSLTKRHSQKRVSRPRNQQQRQQQQHRYIPKGISNSRAAAGTRNNTTTPLLASPNQPASLGDSYDYSVPSSTAEESSQEHDDQLLQQQTVESTANASSISPYGMGGYGMAGGYNSMMMPPMMMGGGGYGMGPFSGLYQVLYGVQNIVFSISQAVQLVGMNQQVLQQSWESLTKMVDHAISTFHEMRALELQMENNNVLTPQDQQRRKRLKALRYALVMGGSWLTYKIIRHLLFYKKNRRRLAAAGVGANSSYNSSPGTGLMGALGMSSMSPFSSSSYYGGGYSPYSSSLNNNMFHGGGGYGYSSGGGFY